MSLLTDLHRSAWRNRVRLRLGQQERRWRAVRQRLDVELLACRLNMIVSQHHLAAIETSVGEVDSLTLLLDVFSLQLHPMLDTKGI